MNFPVPHVSVMAPTVKVSDQRGLRREDAAVYVGVSPSTFDKMVKDHLMPPPKKVYSCRIWDKQALDRAFEALKGDESQKGDWDDF